jgi:Macrocin-O-methyltransferase (TylF)
MSVSLPDRVAGWLKQPPAERRRRLRGELLRFSPWVVLTFGTGFARLANMFWAYQPDSHALFDEHPEFRGLFSRFSRHNRLNNAGDTVRLWAFILNIKKVLEDGIEGDFAELGVWRGNSSAVLAHFASLANRSHYLFDTFGGFDERDISGIDPTSRPTFSNTSIATAQQVIGPAWDACRVVAGRFPDSIRLEHRDRKYAVVSLDCDLYEPMKAALDFFYPRVSPGGLLLLHDYANPHWPGVRRAVDEFCALAGEPLIVVPDKSGTAVIRRRRDP